MEASRYSELYEMYRNALETDKRARQRLSDARGRLYIACISSLTFVVSGSAEIGGLPLNLDLSKLKFEALSVLAVLIVTYFLLMFLLRWVDQQIESLRCNTVTAAMNAASETRLDFDEVNLKLMDHWLMKHDGLIQKLINAVLWISPVALATTTIVVLVRPDLIAGILN